MPLSPRQGAEAGHTVGRSIYRRIAKAVWVCAVPLAVLFVLLSCAVYWETERWWFNSLGQGQVYGSLMSWRFGAFAVVAGGYALLLGWNARLAWRIAAASSAPLGWGSSWDGTGSRRLIPLEDKLGLDRFRVPGTVLFVVIVSWLAGYTAANNFDLWLEAYHGGVTGIRDELWGRDLGFYFFQLPALGAAAVFVFWAIFLTLVLSVLIYIYEEAIELGGREMSMPPEVTRHLGSLCALLVAWKSVEWRLDALDSQSSGGLAPGFFGYAAEHFRLPALTVGYFLAPLMGLTVFVLARKNRGRMVTLISAGFPLTIWICAAVVPLWAQAHVVEGNETQLESENLRRNARATLTSWRLDTVRKLPATGHPSAAAQREALVGLPIWPAAAVRNQLNQQFLASASSGLRAGRPHLESWLINGQKRLVYVMAVQQDDWKADIGAKLDGNRFKGGLAVVDAAKQHPNDRLTVYLAPSIQSKVASPITPASTQAPLSEAVYPVVFGEWPSIGNPEIAARNPNADDIDPQSSANTVDWVPATAQAPASVPLNSVWRRVLAAWRFWNSGILRGSAEGLYWHRKVAQRCFELAPFLDWHQADPRLVSDGQQRLVWLLDGYALSRRYPNAATPRIPGTPFGASNYVRRAVVATVDARNGRVQFFAPDLEEPFTALYRRAFPDLIQPMSAMPEALRKQVRNPDPEFAARASIWARYHGGTRDVSALISDTSWYPAFGPSANRDGGFVYHASAKLGGTSAVPLHASAFKDVQSQDDDPQLQFCALLIQGDEFGSSETWSWRPNKAIQDNQMTTGTGIQDRDKYQLLGALPVGDAVAISKSTANATTVSDSHLKESVTTTTVSALWHVASTDGTIVFPMDSGGSKTSAAQLRQDFDAAARAWRAREEAQHELNYSKIDEMDRELNRLFSR